jgi:hypothetical protein
MVQKELKAIPKGGFPVKLAQGINTGLMLQ